MARKRQRSTTTNLLIGAVAGVVGAWAMNAFQRAWLQQYAADSRNVAQRYPRSDEEVMRIIAVRAGGLFERKLNEQEINSAALALHYGFGAATGAAYAVLASKHKLAMSGLGTAFGTVFFAGGYLVAPQDLKPCVPSEEQPATVSAIYEWLTHVVYGMTVEATRRALVKAIR